LRTNQADQVFPRPMRPHARASRPHVRTVAANVAASKRSAPRPRMPSTYGYMIAAGVTAVALFFVLWWMLHSSGDEVPWLPAGLAASVVMVVAAAARQVVMRRAWTRYILEQDRREPSLKPSAGKHKTGAPVPTSAKADAHYAALRTVQRHSAEADASGEQPEAHLEAYHLCKDYLATTEDALRQGRLAGEKRAAIRSGRDRVRLLQRHHLLAWASISVRAITQDAQRRASLSDKIETAQRAIDVINAALKIYPEERELLESTVAIEEFIASVKVAHWVEMAERAAFKGQYRRAIDRYRDALFYASRGGLTDEAQRETSERIGREIELLRARLKLTKLSDRKGSSTAARPTNYRQGEEI
jgi:hypothetical protein